MVKGKFYCNPERNLHLRLHLRALTHDFFLQYNYTLAAALNVGTLLSIVFIFLTLSLPKVSLNWSGNTIWQKSELRITFLLDVWLISITPALDYMGPSYKPVPETGFGPSTCEFELLTERGEDADRGINYSGM